MNNSLNIWNFESALSEKIVPRDSRKRLQIDIFHLIIILYLKQSHMKWNPKKITESCMIFT